MSGSLVLKLGGELLETAADRARIAALASAVASHRPLVLVHGGGRATRTAAHRSTSGTVVDLGEVGDPADPDPSLIELMLVHGYVPVIASLGISETASATDPGILNVNADVMACRIASAIGAGDLVIAGGTAGVLDDRGDSIAMLDTAGIDEVIAGGTATAGMVAKLSACRTALLEGVSSVRIIDGKTLDAVHGVDDAPGTTLVLSGVAAR